MTGMDFITDHANEMFKPGKATMFFRNLTAVMVCVYFLQGAGVINLRSTFWKTISEIIPIDWPRWGGMQAAFLAVLLFFKIVLTIVESRVLHHFINDLKDPDSAFYIITAWIWVARGIVEAISYLLWFICMFLVLSYGHTCITDILTGAIAFFTFQDIITGNYLTYKQMIEKTHLPER